MKTSFLLLSAAFLVFLVTAEACGSYGRNLRDEDHQFRVGQKLFLPAVARFNSKMFQQQLGPSGRAGEDQYRREDQYYRQDQYQRNDQYFRGHSERG